MQFPDHVLTSVVDDLDQETMVHCRRVEFLVLTIGKLMELTSAELSQLSLGAYIHDVGKKCVPEAILKKKGPLTPQEWDIIEMHPKWGYDVAASLGLSETAKRIVLEHHLWANGQGGYPQELIGTKPSLLTQITTVADVFDAMINHRPYRSALSTVSAMEYLTGNVGTRFNEDVVATFEAKIFPSFRIPAGGI
ncbi:MAG: HD-GYP domain-containing protein [Limnochordia bacterium]